MVMRRSTWQAREDRQAKAIAEDRLTREMWADLRRFDAWPEHRAEWLQFLARQSYHRERMAASDAYRMHFEEARVEATRRGG